MTTLFLATGCGTPKQKPNPLEGWKFCYSDHPLRSNQKILTDYRDYIEKLSPEEKRSVGSIDLFEDGMGQSAVRIVVNLDGTRWAHILIYDADYKRTKVIKYPASRYKS